MESKSKMKRTKLRLRMRRFMRTALNHVKIINLGDPRVIQWKRIALMSASGIVLLISVISFGSVESSLAAVQSKLVGTLLPLAAICGLILAGFSFVAGHPNARQHLFFAIIGAIVGFGAESIVALIRSLIH